MAFTGLPLKNLRGPINVKRGKKYSYGRRMSRPVYAYFDKKYYDQSCSSLPSNAESHTWTRVVQSESVFPLEHSIKGTSIGYDSVIVYDGENGENGKTIFGFENVPPYHSRL
jgi:hypothetical protein